MPAAEGLTVKRSPFLRRRHGRAFGLGRVGGFYIADNDMLGRESLDYVFTWYAIEPWVSRPDFAESGKMKSFYAVSDLRQGHVIAYNRVRGFHDGIDHATYGMPDGCPDTPRIACPSPSTSTTTTSRSCTTTASRRTARCATCA